MIRSAALTLVALLSWLSASPARGQVLPRVHYIASYTDNLFRSHDPAAAWVTNAYVELDYAGGPDLSLYYTGDASLVSERDELFNQTHRVGLSHFAERPVLGLLNAGVELSLRLDQPLYGYRDYLDLETYATARRYLDEATLAQAGCSVRLRDYTNAGAYSYLAQTLFGQASRFLPSQTTLVGRASIGVKTYLKATPNAASSEARSGRDRSLVQLHWRLKLAQGLGADTGLQLIYQRRHNLAGQSRFADISVYDTDDELFDDHYSYSGDLARTTLKHLAPANSMLTISLATERRDFAGRPALDLQGFTIPGDGRSDRRNTLKIAAERSFRPGEKSTREVALRLEWLVGDVDSNDPYYDAAYQVVSAGVQVDF